MSHIYIYIQLIFSQHNTTDTASDSYKLSTIIEKIEKPNAQFTGNSKVLHLVKGTPLSTLSNDKVKVDHMLTQEAPSKMLSML